MSNDYYAIALFNAARRYCIDQSDLLYETARSSPIYNPEAQPPEVKALQVGFSILRGILYEIELAKPSDFRTASEARAYLQQAGKNAIDRSSGYITGKKGHRHVVYNEPDWTIQERAAADNARATYINYITDLPPSQAALLDPVPYRHILNKVERLQIRKKLARRWKVDPDNHTWYPLWDFDTTPSANIVAFQLAWFQAEINKATLKSILLDHGIARIWQIQETMIDHEYEIDVPLCDFWGHETYWSSPDLNWLIYVSHESSITFAGDWLLTAIKQHWPNWQQRLYTGYDYIGPPSSNNHQEPW